MRNITVKKIFLKEIFFLLIMYLTFIALGLPDTGFGVAWNEIRLDFDIPLEAAGGISAIVTSFAALSGFSSGYLLNRFGTGKVTAFTCLLTAIAILGYSVSNSYIALLFLAIPLGFGAGAVDTCLNSYAAENLSSKHMSWLHCSWGIGATLSPLLITFGISYLGSWRYGYGSIGFIVLILSVIILLSLPLWKDNNKSTSKNDIKPNEKPQISGLAPILSIVSYMVYVFLEGGLGLWLSALLIESRNLNITLAGSSVGFYFGSITLGRFIMGFIVDKIGNRKTVKLGLTLRIIGSILFLNRDIKTIYILGIILIGLGFAPIFPTLMHETSNRYGSNQAKKIIGNQVAFSYISFLILVPCLGFIATHTFLEIIPIIVFIGIILLYLVIAKLDKLT